jgi:dihydroneopterin aldolase
MAVIALEGMRFCAYHGVFEHERRLGNHFEVDVWINSGDIPLPDTDNIADALDYGKVFEAVQAVMVEPKNLLESLVNGIGHRLTALFPQVVVITVRVSKENPPVGGECKRSYAEAAFRP